MSDIKKIEKLIVGWRVKEDGGLPRSIKDSHAPKRLPEIECDIHHANIKGDAWTILIGLLNGRPYEVIGGLSKHVEIPKKYKDGIVIKNSRKTVNSRYDLKFGENGDEVLIKDIVSVFDNPNYGSITRMISMSLRHGVPIQYLVEQLQKDKHSDMFSFSKVIARVLKKYIKDGVSGAGKCDNCGSNELIYQAGCPICKDCGYSKCG
jgi:ribonucleoside-diphosphate reductase alpha chain